MLKLLLPSDPARREHRPYLPQMWEGSLGSSGARLRCEGLQASLTGICPLTPGVKLHPLQRPAKNELLNSDAEWRFSFFFFFLSRHSLSTCCPRCNSAAHYDKRDAWRSRERSRVAFIKPPLSHRCHRGLTSQIGLENVFGVRISGSGVALQIFQLNITLLRSQILHRKINKASQQVLLESGSFQSCSRIVWKIKNIL